MIKNETFKRIKIKMIINPTRHSILVITMHHQKRKNRNLKCILLQEKDTHNMMKNEHKVLPDPVTNNNFQSRLKFCYVTILYIHQNYETMIS